MLVKAQLLMRHVEEWGAASQNTDEAPDGQLVNWQSVTVAALSCRKSPIKRGEFANAHRASEVLAPPNSIRLLVKVQSEHTVRCPPRLEKPSLMAQRVTVTAE